VNRGNSQTVAVEQPLVAWFDDPSTHSVAISGGEGASRREGIVSGLITPDQYVPDRESGSLVREFIALQPTAIVCDAVHGGTLSTEEGGARVLNDRQVSGLRDMGLKVETFFGSRRDVEWCIRGDELLSLQSRPITTL